MSSGPSWTPPRCRRSRSRLGSERVLNRPVQEVAAPRRARLLNELAGEEVAVARVELHMPREVVGGQQIDLGADVAGGGPGPRAEYGSSLVVEGIAIGCAPEEVLLKGQDQTADRGHADAPAGTDDVLPPDVVDVAEVRVAIRIELIEGADVPARFFVSARIIEFEVDAGRQTRDRQRVAEHAGEHPSGDVPAPHRPELACSLDLEVQVGLADLAPGPASQRLAVLAPGGAVEGGERFVDAEPVEVQVHGQEAKRSGAEGAQKMLIRRGIVEFVLVDDRHRQRPE